MKYSYKNKYVSVYRLKIYKVIKNILLIIGGFFACCFASFILNILPDFSYYYWNDSDIIVLVLFLIITFLFLYNGIKIRKLIELTYQYNTIFEGEKNGIVTMNELEKQLAKSSNQIRSELRKLFRKKWIINCTLQNEGDIAVIINDQKNNAKGVGFHLVECENCGGFTRIRIGSHGQCQYCGGRIESKV